MNAFARYCALASWMALTACSGLTSEESADSTAVAQADSLGIDSTAASLPVEAPEAVLVETPLLDGALAKHAAAKTLVDTLKAWIAHPDRLKSDADVEALLSHRVAVSEAIQYEVLEGFFYEMLPKMENSQQVEAALSDELGKLGLQPVFAEGSYIALAEAAFFEERIREVASEPLRLFIDFRLAHADGLGGEYPYSSLDAQHRMVDLAERLQAVAPKSPYLTQIANRYDEAIMALTDAHTTPEFGCILFGVSRDPYPNASGLEHLQAFVDRYGKSKLQPVVKKILANISAVGAGDSLYVLEVARYPDASQARMAALKALKAGQDLPHVLMAQTPDGTRYLHAYRFYPEAAKAEAELPKAVALAPAAKISPAIIKNGDSVELAE